MRTLPIAAALLALAAVLYLARQVPRVVRAAPIQNHPAAAQSASSVSPPITWSHDIAPLAYAHCTTCHHPGGAGPFSLLTYADACRWGPQIATVTQSHFMPPWLPEPGYGNFADVRRLSDRRSGPHPALGPAPACRRAIPPQHPRRRTTTQPGSSASPI